MKRAILIGGGYSVKEAIGQGLWDKIKSQEIWSLNFAFMKIPYLPRRELWVDISFFKNNIVALQKLWQQGVKMYAKHNSRYVELPEITTYEATRHTEVYKPKEALNTASTPHLFHGKQGLVGIFALSLAVAEGYTEIFLLGYDYGIKNSEQKKTHFYQGELDILSSGVNNPRIYLKPDGKIKDDVRDFDIFSKLEGVTIYNVSVDSNINCFQKLTYKEFFDRIERK